jgi:glycolate dehydrogenase FAD-binding subunit
MSDLIEELTTRVLQARAAAGTLEIVGGGSKAFMGRATQADAAIDVGHHRGIVAYEPDELVLTARAGTPLAEIEASLAECGQVLAFDPPQYGGGATIGGTLACNQSGPARPWQGSVRDAVLGIRLINGRGEHLRFGGRVMKNVAGYDVSRAQAGAFGTLGIITEVSLKVMPAPEATLTLVQDLDAAQAVVRMNELAGRFSPLTGACWHDGQLYLRLSGVEAAVQATARRWGGERLADGCAFWRALRDQDAAFFQGTAPLWRFSINAAAPHWRPQADWLIDWGGAQRWLPGEFGFAALAREAEQAGGQVALFRGGDRSGEVFASPSPAVKTLHQRLKAAFDPDGIFNPGRLYSWL